jgi:hypothetical protein
MLYENLKLSLCGRSCTPDQLTPFKFVNSGSDRYTVPMKHSQDIPPHTAIESDCDIGRQATANALWQPVERRTPGANWRSRLNFEASRLQACLPVLLRVTHEPTTLLSDQCANTMH